MKNLNFLTRGLFSLLLAFSLVTFTGCGDDDPSTPVATETLYELVTADSDLSQLKVFIDADAELKGYLEGATEYTFFAPNDAAFEKLKALLGTDDLTSVAPSVIGAVLRFHFAVGNFASSAIAGGTISTVQGESIVGNADGTIFTGGSDESVIVLAADIAATNGVMHKVETILIPPTIFLAIGANLGKLSQPLLLGANFTTLAAGITKADAFAAGASQTLITSILAGEDEYTVFAPSNGTFEAASLTVDSFTGEQWYGIITNHVISGTVTAANITAPSVLTALSGGTLTVLTLDAPTNPEAGILTGIAIDSSGDTTPEAQVAVGDAFAASNGVLHVIAGILTP